MGTRSKRVSRRARSTRTKKTSWQAKAWEFSKQPTVWVFGIVVSVVGTWATAMLTNLAEPVTTYLSETTCNLVRSPSPPDINKFKILISPLAGDKSGNSTARLMRVFHGEEGFRVVPICESLTFDLSKTLDASEKETVARGASIIKREQADLLLFGIANVADKSLQVWAINEHGGCALKPKSIVLKDGLISEDFDFETKNKLVEVSIAEIAAACLNQEKVDWRLFEKRVEKIDIFLKNSGRNFSRDQINNVSDHYFLAAFLLYQHNIGDHWFVRGDALIKKQVADVPSESVHDERRGGLWRSRALLLGLKAYRSKAEGDWTAVINAYTAAIKYVPKDAFAFYSRAYAYLQVGDNIKADSDFANAIVLSPSDPETYKARAERYLFGPVGTDPAHEVEQGLKDLDRALTLAADDANLYWMRGVAHFYRAEFSSASEDFARIPKSKKNTYTVLLQHLSLRRLGAVDHNKILEMHETLKEEEWPYPIIELYLDKRSVADTHTGAKNVEQRCEANFYIGQLYLLHEKLEEALIALETAVETCPKNYVEYRGAILELARLRAIKVAN